jgi:hypothetical protein
VNRPETNPVGFCRVSTYAVRGNLEVSFGTTIEFSTGGDAFPHCRQPPLPDCRIGLYVIIVRTRKLLRKRVQMTGNYI